MTSTPEQLAAQFAIERRVQESAAGAFTMSGPATLYGVPTISESAGAELALHERMH